MKLKKKIKINYEFNTNNLQNTLVVPILNIFKYFFSYFYFFNTNYSNSFYIFYLLQNFQNSYKILNNILGLTIFITTLAVIAKFLKLDSNQNNSQDFCNNLKDLTNILDKIKVIICIIKNLYFLFLVY